jgi:hypothetical protein
MNMRRLGLALVLVGCAGDDSQDAGGPDDEALYDDDDLPAGTCRDTGTDTDPCETGGTTVVTGDGAAPDDGCQGSADCMGGFCAAAFDPVAVQRGELTCQFACVPLLDDDQWCADDASCCDQGAVCAARGYCVMLDDAGTSTGTGGE